MALGTLGIGEQINGVNLGNWLVLEKWMKPGIFAASGEADEIWLHRATGSAELEALLTRHRDTYITEADFRNIVTIEQAGERPVRSARKRADSNGVPQAFLP